MWPFQGLKELDLQNWEKLPGDLGTSEAVLLTHAHLDHCGYIPLLVNNEFFGEIHCTQPTQDLTEIILKDIAKIQEEEAERLIAVAISSIHRLNHFVT